MKMRSRSVSQLVAPLAVALLLAGCTQPTEPDPPPPAQDPRSPPAPAPGPTPMVVAPPPAPQPTPQLPPPPSATAVMSWSLSDGCNDGPGIGVRLFDKTNNLVWPGASQYRRTGAGGAVDVATISCTRGARICFGAATAPQTNTCWGIGLHGTRGCDGCCFQCNDVRVSRSLTCS